MLLAEALAFVGHALVVAIGQADAAQELAGIDVARDDRSVFGGQRVVLAVEPQVALLLLRAVAGDAALLQDRRDIADEVDLWILAVQRGGEDEHAREVAHAA